MFYIKKKLGLKTTEMNMIFGKKIKFGKHLPPCVFSILHSNIISLKYSISTVEHEGRYPITKILVH